MESRAGNVDFLKIIRLDIDRIKFRSIESSAALDGNSHYFIRARIISY